jgi:hypothetical protein
VMSEAEHREWTTSSSHRTHRNRLPHQSRRHPSSR